MPAVPDPTPACEASRLEVLHELRVLDTLPEAVYDDIVLLASQICGTPIGLITLVDAERQWFKARVGIDASETHRDLSFCAHAIAAPAPVFIIEDTTLDPRFRDNPFVTGEPHVRFYAGASIVMPGGQALGTVCVVDTVPRVLDAAQIAALRALSRQTTALLELRLRTRASDAHRSALERAQELQQRMGALAKVGGWELEIHTGKITWTEEVYRIHELDLATELGLVKNIDFYAPPARPLIEKAIADAIAHGTPYDLELPFVTATGRALTVRAQGEAVMQGGRAVRLFGSFQDITERRRTEEALARSEHRLRLALSREGLAVFDWDLAADQVYRSANFSVMLGGPPQSCTSTSADAHTRVHPADKPAAHEAVMSALRGEADGYDFEHRVQRLDGTWVWVHAVGRVTERGPDGRALRVSGTDEDVTAAKAAEAALVESRRRLRLLADNLPALIAHVDNAQRYRFLNAHIGRTRGLDVEATIGRTMREVRGEAIHAKLAPHIEAALRGEKASFTYTEETGGRIAHYRSDYIPDIDVDGQVQGFYAMTFDITELKETQRQLELLARVDTLTGLPNRRQFDERIADALLRARRTKQTLAVMFLDIDNFKRVNDSVGHAGGDAVLREFATRLRGCVRATDTVARLAGDEFVVLVESVTGARELGVLAEKVVACIRPSFLVEGATLAVTTSIGVATSHAGEPGAAEVLRLADAALYRAKRQGRDGYVIA